MKNNIVFVVGLTAGVMVAMSATLIAGQVATLTTFTSGTPAVAADVNNNFTAIKTAIDDNNARIAALESKNAAIGVSTGQAHNGSGGTCIMGELMLFAGGIAGAMPALGQTLSINQNQALFSLLGTKFGGDGVTTFALPDLRSVSPNNTTYAICTSGVYPASI